MTWWVELVKALAWPTVVLLLGWPLRKHAKALVDRVKRIKAGGNEIELGEVPQPSQLERPKEPEQKALPPPKETPQLEAGQPAAAPDLLVYAPGGAVVNAWARLENMMRQQAIRLEVLAPNEAGVLAGALITRLLDTNAIDEHTAGLVRTLLQMRQAVVHEGAAISTAAAARYVDTAESLMRTIETFGDIIYQRRILEQLKVDVWKPEQMREVVVGPLANVTKTGFLVNRSGWWAARRGGVIIKISERDAALLLARGAQLGDPEA
jgi:hypothetical protein